MLTFVLRGWGQMALPAGWLLASVGPAPAEGPRPTLSASPSSAGSAIPVLTNALQVLELSPEQAKANLGVQICGRVTCYDHGRVLFVQDQTSGVFLYYTGDRLPIRQGEAVQVSGLAKMGRYSPIIDSPTIKPEETGPTIKPRPISLGQVYLGGLDAQWVEFTGVVRTQTILDNRFRLELADPPYRIPVWIPNYQGYEALRLPGSLVRICGVVGACVSDRHQLEGFQVFANTLADIAVLRPPPGEPFSMPVRLISNLKTHYFRRDDLARARVHGTITLVRLGRGFFVQDATGGLEVQTQAPPDGLRPGTAVDVVGYLTPGLVASRLEDALVRVLGTNALPQPAPSSSDELFSGRHDNQLVQIDASFLGRVSMASNYLALALQDGGHYLSAVLEAPGAPAELTGLEPGCRLRLVGVCHREAELGTGPVVSVLLRYPSDVQVVAPAGSRRAVSSQALAAAAILATMGLMVALWFLHHQRGRTEATLRTQATLQAEMRRSEQQLRRSLEERERFGRDLHDDIIQSIYAAGLSLEECRRVVRQSPERAEERIATAIQMLNNSIRSVRDFIAGLEPKVLNGREFKTALKSLALTSGDGPNQVQLKVEPTAANSLTSSQATQLLRIAKEAISNSLRHGHAATVTVSLRPVSAGIRLEVHDDGLGFDPGAVGNTGQGLRNIATRARDVGATLEIISARGQGCHILVTVPPRNTNDLD
jgi:signal transduction histidine kinase